MKLTRGFKFLLPYCCLIDFCFFMAPKTRPSWRQNSTPQPMASAPLSTSLPTSSSSCSKLISLMDWWLIKSETDVDGKRLAVGGYHYSCEEKTMHIFTSATVVKTFDPYTVETADGCTIRLQGLINRSRMQQNGFPPEVSQCFFNGFPYNWEYHAKKDFRHIIPNSANFPTSSVTSNEGIFPVPMAFEFPLVKLLNDCASNPESSVDDLLPKFLTPSSVNAESDNTLYINNDCVQSETISASEKGNDNVERCTQHECHELQNGVSCEHLTSSLPNVNCDNQNESRQMLQTEYLCNKESEINNGKLCFENTFYPVKITDDFSNALSPEDLESLYTQQEDNSAGKDPEVITRKMSLALEASSESPQARTQRNTNTESNPASGVISMHDRVGCKHLPSNSSNVKCDNQNESWEILPVESLCSKGAEINNEKLSFEKTVDSVNNIDDFSNALSPEDLKSLHSQQKDNSANKDPEFRTKKMSSTLEASFESPQVSAQRNTDTESSKDKFCSSLSSPFASSILKLMMRRKRHGSELKLQSYSKRVRLNPPNDDLDVLGSTFDENTDILPLSGKESMENDTKTSTADASPVRKNNSDCYMLRSCDAKMEINSPNCEKKSKWKPLNLSKLDNKEPQNAPCVNNLNQNMGSNSTHGTGASTNLKDNHKGGQILESAVEVECEGTYIADDTNKQVNDIGNIKHCINKMNALDEDVLITQTKDYSECSSDYSEIRSGTCIKNEAIGTFESEKNGGITNNQDENQAEVFQEYKVSKFKKTRNQVRVQSSNILEDGSITNIADVDKLASVIVESERNGGMTNNQDAEVFQESKVSKLNKTRNQVRVQSTNISEEMKSPWTRGKIGKQKATISSSPELLNPKRSRSGRLLLPPINRWEREIVHDMDGSITNIVDVDKLASVIVESESNGGITNNQVENQAEVFQESKVSKLKKARNQVIVTSTNISEEMKSPLTRGKIGKQKATLSTSPELLNPKRSRSGRLLLPPINRWRREIVYDMDGSITNIVDVDKLSSVSGRLLLPPIN